MHDSGGGVTCLEGRGPHVSMRRALLVVWFACQACLGLAVIGLSAVSQLAFAERADGDSRAQASTAARSPLRSAERIPSQGPSLP
ncbi:MAG: hypothetical protein IPK00_27800 [Deltaproteobacteria bacterium]|nr:hypothetical protein [Deltaproteobacteria bacterium]